MKKLTIVLLLLSFSLLSFSQDIGKYKFVSYTYMSLVNPMLSQYRTQSSNNYMQSGSIKKINMSQKMYDGMIMINPKHKDIYSPGDSIIMFEFREDVLVKNFGYQFKAKIIKVDTSDGLSYTCQNTNFGKCCIIVFPNKNQIQLRLNYEIKYDLYRDIFVFLTQKID